MQEAGMEGIRKNRFADEVFVWLLYATAFGMPWLRPQWHGILMGLLAVSWILAKGPKGFTNFRDYAFLLAFAGMFFLDVIGLMHTRNFAYGLSYLETELPLLVFPAIILTSTRILTQAIIRNTIIAFIAGVITLNLASLGFISWDLWDPGKLEANVIVANNSIAHIHPVFLSLYISFGLLFILGNYFPPKTQNRFALGWILFSSSVLLVYLLWMNSRVGIAGFIIAAAFYILYPAPDKKRWPAVAGLAVIIVLLIAVPFSRARFIDASVHVIDPANTIDLHDYNTRSIYFRKDIYRCSYDLIDGPEFLYGYGTGDFKDVLMERYEANHLDALASKKLDAHSEYFAQLHRIGIVGLIFFTALLVIQFRYAIKFNSPIYASFIILFGITALFETVLSSQKGVSCFGLFSPLLFMYARMQQQASEAESPSLNKIS